MLFAVVLGFLYSREIKSKDIIPGLTKIWNVLELRILVLISLSLQIVLIIFGNRRKYKANTLLQFIVWFTYLSADWVATVALGILSKDTKDRALDPNFVFMASWAPFLLVHLGGPDNITAYSLEDNELWLRHMLGLFYQLAVAVYVIQRSWNGTILNLVTLPVIAAGIIKYGERTWALRSGSSKNFRESILPSPDPGPNYAKFMDEYSARKAEGYQVSLGTVIDGDTTPIVLGHSQEAITNDSIPDAISLHDGFYFFGIFKRLFADLILSFQDHRSSQLFFQNISWSTAFEIVEVELGLMYDMLYTKAVLTYSRLGIFLKTVSFSCTLSAFIAFCFLVAKEVVDKEKTNFDKRITFVLYIGAILLEIYAVIVLLSSNWAIHWLSKRKNWRVNLLCKFISCFQTCFRLSHTKRWSNLISQFNLISFCLKDEPVKCIRIQKLLHIYQFFEMSYYQRSETVPDNLKILIFELLWEKSWEASDIEACKKLCAQRGDQVLEKLKCHAIDWSIKVEFDQSILLWHIATDLCYYSDVTNNSDSVNIPSCTISKLLSNYMMYLLVICPFMLPNGIGQIRFQDTCAEASELFQERKYISNTDQVCKLLLRTNTEILPSKVKGDRSKSVLFDACRLAKSLQSLETEGDWSKEQKWEMMSHVWVEMLCHAASQCRGIQHAKQLNRGGELLTHVWLLMAHLGISEQFQISRGHARAKLEMN